MTSAPPQKRLRTATLPSSDNQKASASASAPSPLPSSPPSVQEVCSAIRLLTDEQVEHFLISACLAHPGTWAAVSEARDRSIAALKATVIDFDHLSKLVWREINITNRRLSESEIFDRSFQVALAIRRVASQVARQADQNASEGTRANGVEVLRKFGKSVLVSKTYTAYELRRRCADDFAIVHGMKKIVRCMNGEERERLMSPRGDHPEFGPKLREMVEMSKEAHCLEGLNMVLHMLEGKGDGDEEDDDWWDEEEEDGEEEDESHDEYF